MMIRVTTTSRLQQRYDHRLRCSGPAHGRPENSGADLTNALTHVQNPLAASSGKRGSRQLVLTLHMSEQVGKLGPAPYGIQPLVGHEQRITAETRRRCAFEQRNGILGGPEASRLAREVVEGFRVAEARRGNGLNRGNGVGPSSFEKRAQHANHLPEFRRQLGLATRQEIQRLVLTPEGNEGEADHQRCFHLARQNGLVLPQHPQRMNHRRLD